MGFDTIFDAQYLENLKGKDVQEIQYFLAIVFYRTFKKTYTYISYQYNRYKKICKTKNYNRIVTNIDIAYRKYSIKPTGVYLPEINLRAGCIGIIRTWRYKSMIRRRRLNLVFTV